MKHSGCPAKPTSAWSEGSIATAPKVLLIGPLPSPTEVIGGSKVSFQETVRNLQHRGFNVVVLNTTRPRANLSPARKRASDLLALMRIIRDMLPHLKNAQVAVLNMSLFGLWFVVPCLSICCRLAHVPLVLRFFGNGHRFYRFGPVARWLASRVILRCPLVYVETMRLQKHLDAPNVRWLPNVRDLTPRGPQRPSRKAQHRVANMVFIGQLRMAKGVREALDASRDLPDDCRLTVFGPCMDMDMSLFKGHPRARYGGILSPDDVADTLASHDLLLFPSYWVSEGYPGIVVEAFQMGVPVVATRWNDIPELVQDGYNGLLVEPRSASALRSAVERLRDDPHLYQQLCEGARRTGERFRSAIWYDEIVREVRSLVEVGDITSGPAALPSDLGRS